MSNPTPVEATLPSFRRVWDNLIKNDLSTSTLSVCIFSAAVPTATFFGDLLFEISSRKPGIPVSDVVARTFWPTLISALVILAFWSALLGWSLKKTIIGDRRALLKVIAEKDTYIQQLGEIMQKRAEEDAKRANTDVATIYRLEEDIRQIKAQVSRAEEQLYSTRTELANERDRVAQPDVGLIWDWPEDVRFQKSLMGDTEKLIMVDNRSDQFIYNVQIEAVKLHQELSFDLINELGPTKQLPALGRWNGKSSLSTNYIYFFGQDDNEKEMAAKGWVYKKNHNRGFSDFFVRVPIALTYESNGVKWRTEFDFVYDPGDESLFIKKSGQRLNK